MNTKTIQKKKSPTQKHKHVSDTTPDNSNDFIYIPTSSLKINITLAALILFALVVSGYEIFTHNQRIFQKLHVQSSRPDSYLICDIGTCVISPVFLHLKK